MTAWARIPGGWAFNLDGSDAATVFSLPRVEVHATARCWRGVCLRLDGTRSDRFELGDSVHQARAAAEAAWGVRD